MTRYQTPRDRDCSQHKEIDDPSGPVNRVLLLGYGVLALGLLEGLLACEHCKVVGVFRWSRHPRFRGRMDQDEKSFANLIRRHRIPEIRCDSVNSAHFLRQIQDKHADTVLIGTWGEILKSDVLRTPHIRFINCHPSLLPAHRGANPYASSIRSGETQTGVTFHLVDETIDTGPIILQATVDISDHDTGETLRNRCALKAQALVPQLIDRLNQEGQLRLTHQTTIGSGSYYPPLASPDGLIPWEQSATEIHNLIRGIQPWIDPYTFATRPMGSVKLIPHGSVLRPATSAVGEAGTVRSIDGPTIWVGTGNGQHELGLRDVDVCVHSVRLPRSLSRIVQRWWIRPGMVFTTSPPQRGRIP